MLLNNLGVSFQWHIGKESKKLECRDLTVPEKLKLFQHLQMSTILPTCEKSAQIQKLWADSIDIIDFHSNDEVMNLKGEIGVWLSNFLELYKTNDVIPYMHALYAHVPEFLNLYTNIAHHTQQGMEK